MFYNSVDTGQILEQFEKNVELGGSVFFIGQKTALNQRSGMILEVQIQNSGAHAHCMRLCMHIKDCIFKKFLGGLNINICCVKICIKLLLIFFILFEF